MAVDDRMVTKNAAGEDFDLSRASEFSFTQFYRDHLYSERLQISRDEMTWLERYAKPDQPAEVVLNLSCGVQNTPHLMLTQVALFEALGVDFVATAGNKYCCGRPFQRFGKGAVGDNMAARAIDRFASWQPEVNVQCCGSCLIEFNYHVRVVAEERGEAPFEVIHITDYLVDRLIEMGDDVPWRKSIPRRVMVHAEGAEVHPTKEAAKSATIRTLELIPGIEYVGIVESPALGQPCATKGPGEPSVLNDITPEQYLEVCQDLQDQADAVGADAIVTHHHMCHREWCKFGTNRLPVLHYQSLLAEALGIRIPDRFQTLWKLGDPEKVLQQTRRHWESWGMDEKDARHVVKHHFMPEYASQVQRCPCEGNCAEAVAGTGAAAAALGADCGTSWTATLEAGMELPVLDLV